jgi:DNA polymerase IV
VKTAIRYILHVDADAFFASVEQAMSPELKGLPVIVGGGDRGVVSAASYEARRFGVHSAMPIAQARKLCPQAIFRDPDFRAYTDFSRRMFDIMRNFSPVVEVTSVDEGYIDLTGALRLHKAPAWEIAHRILSEIRAELSINVSGGLAGTRAGAKMATGLAKPNGLLYIEPERSSQILNGLPVGSIPGIGKKSEETLTRYNILTIRDLLAAPKPLIKRLFGRWSDRLLEIASGNDSRIVTSDSHSERKSYSRDRTLEQDTGDLAHVWFVVAGLAEKVASRLRSDGKSARTITFKVRYADFSEKARSVSLKAPTDANRDILAVLFELFNETVLRRKKIRQVGVKLSGLGNPIFQTDLFDSDGSIYRERDRTVDKIRKRFGFQAVRVASYVPGSRLFDDRDGRPAKRRPTERRF